MQATPCVAPPKWVSPARLAWVLYVWYGMVVYELAYQVVCACYSWFAVGGLQLFVHLPCVCKVCMFDDGSGTYVCM